MAETDPRASSRRKPGRVVAPICNGSNHSGHGCQSERAVGLVRPWPLDVPSRNWTVACERLISEISGLYPEIRSTAPSTPRGRDPRRDLQAVAYPPRSATAAEFLRTGPNLCVGQIFISPGSTSFRMSHLDHHNGRVLWRTNLTQQCGTRSNTSPASTQTPPFLFLAFAFS